MAILVRKMFQAGGILANSRTKNPSEIGVWCCQKRVIKMMYETQKCSMRKFEKQSLKMQLSQGFPQKPKKV